MKRRNFLKQTAASIGIAGMVPFPWPPRRRPPPAASALKIRLYGEAGTDGGDKEDAQESDEDDSEERVQQSM
ncbi:MAG: twin-arginine translocation signal domain-containing protein [Pirellulaceae bacterium]|nr:twin-arginine translocation signal domain-containing protein [Pirellulaceae bacterium]